MWGPQTIPKLVNIPPVTMDANNYSINGVYKPIYNVWEPHIVRMSVIIFL